MVKELKEKYEHAKEKQMEMERIYDELKVKYQKETKSSQQLQREIDRPDKRNPRRSDRITTKLNLNQNRNCPR